MGFMEKFKNILGIGGIKLQVASEPSFEMASGTLSGKVVVTSKSYQEVEGINVKFTETRQTGSGDNKSIKEFTLGEAAIGQAFSIKSGETKEIPFSLLYSRANDLNDRLKQSGSAVGKALGGLGKMLQQEKSTFFLTAQASLKGNVFPPTDSMELKAKG
jgi:hypothetical protein